MGSNIYSVRIIRDSSQTAAGVYIKQFFMFCGIYVREYMDDDPEGDAQNVDLNVYLTSQRAESLGATLGDIELKLPEGMLYYEAETRIKYSEELAEKISGFDKEFSAACSQLIHIFTEHDYARLNYQRHCFLHQMSSDEKLDMAQKYYDCYNDLRKLEASYLKVKSASNIYVRFARINCARKVNDVCVARGDLPFFDEEKILDAAEKMLALDQDFSMAYALAGFIGLSYEHLWDRGKENMKKALQKEGEKKHSAFIYYALGHSIEIKEGSFENAWNQYKQILSVSPDYYRGIFKTGCKLLRDKKEKEAYDEFARVRNMMIDREKKEKGGIQPLEIEYKYKCERILMESESIREYAKELQSELKAEVEKDLNRLLMESEFSKQYWTEAERERFAVYFSTKLKEHSLDNIVCPF